MQSTTGQPHEDADDVESSPLSRQAWKLTSIIWHVLTRALLPFAIDRLVEIIPRLVRLLDAMDSPTRVRQCDTFRKTRGKRLRRPLRGNC